ncbi:NACHT domain- and WD repeat-containing protein 1-like [Gigantopelta aegis]|uniref:NACHT domain- and WD repeat-containing protein 1-like n=1 Tax=Gigantopelta aegis TaxID=1735272 RepID=UPI001B88E4E6|nr:NACHT domain- and WD repeat-containing protein 1-like [Gigantopelta aegis]
MVQEELQITNEAMKAIVKHTQVLDDFSEARKVLPNDPELETLTETLQLSQDALISNPDDLPSQVLGRTYNPTGLEQFHEDSKNSPSNYLIPNQKILTPPGGKVVHYLAGHKGDVTSIALSPDGQIAVTCAGDKSIKFWNVTDGKFVWSTDGVGDDPGTLHFCCSERHLVCLDSDQFWAFVVDLETKSFVHKVQPFLPFKTEDGDDNQHTIEAMAMTSDGQELIIANCYDNNLNVYDIKTMKKKHEWKGYEKDFSEKFRLTSKCKELYFPSRRGVVVWNLKDGSRSVILQHTVNVVDVVTADLHIVVTVGDDRVVRIWDTSCEQIEDSHKGQTDGPEENTKDTELILEKNESCQEKSCGTTSELIIQGKVDLECPSTTKIVRIFTSSTFTDSFHERNALMEKVYPNLKKVCQEEGYEFQVVDMRWGVRDEATDDHMTTELCLREVELCKKLSTGPCFVTFLSHKYGYRSFPRLIPEDEFKQLSDEIQSAETKEVIQKWFMRDDNSVPPTYVLQPISSLLPDFKSSNMDLQSLAKKAWDDDRTIMQDAIVSAAIQCLDKVRAHEYEMSECLGPEKKDKESRQLLSELKNALPERIPKNHLILYKIKWSKNGVDPEKRCQHKKYIHKLCVDFESSLLKMIKDGIKTRLQTDQADPLFEEIVQQTLFCQEKCKAFQGRLDSLEKISHYLVDEGRNPFVVYGESGCGKTSIMAMAAKRCWDEFGGNVVVIIRFIGTTPDSSTIGALLTSITLQIMKVYGQYADDMPENIRQLTDAFHNSLKQASKFRPLVILLDSLDQFDPSGGACQLGWLPQSLPPHVKIIVSTLPEDQYESLPILKALNIPDEYFLDIPKLPDNEVSGILDKWLETNGRKLTDFQRRKVMTAFQKCSLPLFLKLSFDQACRWTSYAPPDQTILQTTVRGSIDALLARIEQLHGKLFVSHALAYLTLSKSGLTESELEDILSCDDEVLDDVYTYWTPPMRRLPPYLLVRLKAELGQYLVDRGADGVRVFYWYHRQFIEAARDRYCFDKSETRKRHMDMAEFFSGTWSADYNNSKMAAINMDTFYVKVHFNFCTTMMIYWGYFSTITNIVTTFIMVLYLMFLKFNISNVTGKLKAYKDNKGNESEADRQVTLQPLKFGSTYNLRKLTNLPYHRLQARQTEELKTECLLSFDFIFAKLHAIGLRQVLDDFSEACKVYPNDPELKTLTETLQLSHNALISYPDELPSQVLGRIYNTKGLEQFLEDCKNSPSYYLLPNQKILTPSGGRLVHCLAEHEGGVKCIALSPDGQIAVTCSERHLVCLDSDQFWAFVVDLATKSFIHKVQPFPPFTTEDGDEDQYTIDAMVLTPDGKELIIANSSDNNLNVYDIKTMKKKHEWKGCEQDCSNKFRITSTCNELYFPSRREVVVWNLKDGSRSVILQHTVNVVDVVTTDLHIVVTVGDDRMLRIWDTSREEIEDSHKGQTDGSEENTKEDIQLK